MKKGLFILLIFCFSLTIISCGDDKEEYSATATTTTDTTAPVIAEVTAVTTPTNDSTPNYTFSSDEAGTITYGGSCSSTTTFAIAGNNTITLVSLSEGTYSDCTITVTDSAGNASSALSTSTFVVDTTAPSVSSFTLSDTALITGDTATVTLVFSEAVASFSSAADITVANGTLATMSSADNITWAGTFTPTANTEDASNTLSLATSYTDTAGNAGYVEDFVDKNCDAGIALNSSCTNWEGSEAWTHSGSGIYVGPHVNLQPAGYDTPDGDDYYVQNYTGQSISKFAITKAGEYTITGPVDLTCDWASSTNLGMRILAEVGGVWYGSTQIGTGSNDHGAMDQDKVTDWEVNVSINTATGTWYQATGLPNGYDWRDGNRFSTTPLTGLPAGDITRFGIGWLHTANHHYGAVDNFRPLATTLNYAVETLAPTVSSVSTTADNQSLISITDNITVTFSEAMGTSYITTTTSDTTCRAETIKVSSDNFRTCVRMSSEPVSSNDNKKFTLDPYDNLTVGTTYLTRVTTGVKDTAGNAMSSQYDNSTGFAPVDLTVPTVISISTTADNQSSIAITDNITVTFSEAMDNTSVTTNTDNTSCYGTLGVSSDNFSTCVQMASPNKALDFDGTNDYVAVSNPSSIPVGNESYTIEAWFNADQMGQRGIVGWGNYGAYNQVTALRLKNDGIHHYWWALDLSATTGDISGAWHHIAATWDGTNRKLYLDGVYKNGDQPGAHNVPNASNFRIGSTNNSEYFDGKIDEIRIWNVARTQSEIQANMNKTLKGSESGLVAYYKMNDGSGTNLADSSGSNTGSLNNLSDADWVDGNASFSDPPASSNSGKTFTLDPSDNLTAGTTYKTRVTTGVKDTAGNALSSQYETSTGFTTYTNLMGGAIQGTELSLSTAVTTFAGQSDNDSTDGTGTAARFYSPIGITTDGTNLYVADSGNNRIRKIVIDNGTVTTLAGSSQGYSDNTTGTSARFNGPRGITTDGENLYVVDSGNHLIRKIVISTGVVTTLAGTAGSFGSADNTTGTSASFKNPWGITTDGTNLYVADMKNYTIRKIVISTGAVTTLAGTPGSLGNADNATGTSASFNWPIGITTDGENLYVTETHSIRKIVIDNGTVTTLAGSSSHGGAASIATGTSARFKYPRGITTDGTNLYVVDNANFRIRKIVIDNGTVTSLAGSSGGFRDNNTSTLAKFNYPQGITTDGENLYVTDGNNHRIRKIE